MRTLGILFAFSFTATISAAEPKFVEGSPSTYVENGETLVACEAVAQPAQGQIVQIRYREKGTMHWAYAPTGDMGGNIWRGNLRGLKSGDHEIQIVIMTDTTPPTEVSASEIKVITMP
jgi:hypothetical protein